MKKNQSGVTFIELVVVIFIIMTLAWLTSVNLIGAQRKPPLTGSVDQIVTDLRNQQTKAMTGDTGGSTTNSEYGIHFGQTQYILFRGTVFNPSDSLNLAINLPQDFKTTGTTFSGGNVIFAKGSGEIVNFVSGQNSVTVLNTQNNELKTIYLNRYGTVYEVN